MWTQQHELPASQVYTDLYTEACRCLSRRVGPWNPGYEDLIVGILLDLPKLELPWIVFDGFQYVCDVCVCGQFYCWRTIACKLSGLCVQYQHTSLPIFAGASVLGSEGSATKYEATLSLLQKDTRAREASLNPL